MNIKGKTLATNVSKKKKKDYALRGNLELLMLTLPGIIMLLIFHYLPMFGIPIAFKDYNPNLGIYKSPWNGFENFEYFFTSSDAWRITRNTVAYSMSFLFLGIVVAVTVALLLFNLRSRIGVKVYNTIMILPKFMSMVLIAYIVYALFNPAAGLINQIIAAFGGPSDIDWYSKPEAWPFILTYVHLWQMAGMNSIIYYASLMGVDESLYEAADLDGANVWQKTWHISIPQLIPIMTMLTILGFGSIMSGDFGLFYQTTRDVGTLYPTTDIINTYTFRGLTGGNYTVSAAVGLFQSIVGFVMVMTVNLIVKKVSPENSMF